MPEYLETTAEKFTFRVAADRRYTREGVWVLVNPDGNGVRIGLSDYPQQHNGDVAFAKVKPVGARLRVGELLAEIETIKAMLELQAPVTGTIVEVNPALQATPEIINQSPYEEGWLAVMEVTAWESEKSQLLDAPSYFALMEAEVREESRNV